MDCLDFILSTFIQAFIPFVPNEFVLTQVVVRLGAESASEYDAAPFRAAGVAVADLPFDDCAAPPADVVGKFAARPEAAFRPRRLGSNRLGCSRRGPARRIPPRTALRAGRETRMSKCPYPMFGTYAAYAKGCGWP